MEHAIDDLAAVAAEAATASGEYLRATFRDGSVDGEFDRTDVKATADHESEAQSGR